MITSFYTWACIMQSLPKDIVRLFTTYVQSRVAFALAFSSQVTTSTIQEPRYQERLKSLYRMLKEVKVGQRRGVELQYLPDTYLDGIQRFYVHGYASVIMSWRNGLGDGPTFFWNETTHKIEGMFMVLKGAINGPFFGLHPTTDEFCCLATYKNDKPIWTAPDVPPSNYHGSKERQTIFTMIPDRDDPMTDSDSDD